MLLFMPSEALKDCSLRCFHARRRIAIGACDPALLFGLIRRPIVSEQLFLVIIDRVVRVLQDVPRQHGHHICPWSNKPTPNQTLDSGDRGCRRRLAPHSVPSDDRFGISDFLLAHTEYTSA